MYKYRVLLSNIEKVEVVSEDSKYITYNVRYGDKTSQKKEAKQTNDADWADTLHQAKELAIKQLEFKIRFHTRHVQKSLKQIEEVKKIKDL